MSKEWWATVLFTAIAILFTIHVAWGHDSWISRGAYKNKQGEWCCGDYDCKSYSQTLTTPKGWVIEGEFVPYDDPGTIDKVVPPDGGVTICRRPDGSRRCVFGLKPGI